MIGIITIIITTIMILGIAAIGGMITEKSGIVNLSIEAFMTIGAITFASLVSLNSLRSMLEYQWLIIPLSGLATSAFAIIYIVVTVKLKANQMIAGIALNSLALAISLFLVKFQGRSEIEMQLHLWTIGKNINQISWIFNIALFMGIPLLAFVVLFLGYTKFGKKIRACGENPHAAASLGINVELIQTVAILISAFISGVAGALYVQNISQYFYGNVQGIGFLAVALVIFGQWKPLWIIGGAIIFGSIYSIMNNAVSIPGLNQLGNTDLLKIIPYALSITVLIFTSKKSQAPKYLGKPYYHQGR